MNHVFSFDVRVKFLPDTIKECKVVVNDEECPRLIFMKRSTWRGEKTKLKYDKKKMKDCIRR